MNNLVEALKFPLQNHVLAFSLLLLIIFIVPYFFEKIRIPGLVGLIVMGALVGEHGFNLLLRNSSVVLLGTIGVLYIMFLAGLEIDLHDFKKFKFKSITFGMLTFSIPMVLGISANYLVLNLSVVSAILLASMYASHTLLAYPLASKFKVNKNEAVTVAVGGTMITDTLALLVLAVIASSTKGELDIAFFRQMGISLTLFFIAVLFIFPIIAQWFFRRFNAGGSEQFLFVLSLIFMGGAAAELAGIEPIIGAFFVGLAINPLIPHTSVLGNRLEFIGNTLFIPFFLISVGMLIDITIFYRDIEAIKVAAVMTVTATVSKYLASFLTGKIFRYTNTQTNLIFSLSNAQAAATLAAVLVGHRLELLNDSVLNGTIVMILITCVTSSFVMQRYGKRQAREDSVKTPERGHEAERIVIGLNRPQDMEGLLDLALMLKGSSASSSVKVTCVVESEDDLDFKVRQSRELLDTAVSYASGSGTVISSSVRIDVNPANAITKVAKENEATSIMLGWHGRDSSIDRVFGSLTDQVLSLSTNTVYLANIVFNINTTKRLFLIVPQFASREEGFNRWVVGVFNLAKSLSAKVSIYSTEEIQHDIERVLKHAGISISADFILSQDSPRVAEIGRNLKSDDLLVLVSARFGNISHERYMERTRGLLNRYYIDRNFIVVFPYQD